MHPEPGAVPMSSIHLMSSWSASGFLEGKGQSLPDPVAITQKPQLKAEVLQLSIMDMQRQTQFCAGVVISHVGV